VSVFCLERSNAKIMLRFQVRDTGIGISEDAQASLFNLFVQVDARTSRRYGGTGLGLAISKRLVVLMEGDIGVNSRVGEGSEFWFTAQLNPADAQANPVETFNRNGQIPPHSLGRRPTSGVNDAAQNQPHEQRTGKGKILVAEDGEINRLVVTAMLSKAGYKVEVAENGLEAVNAASACDYDLVLMDVQMPEMDGYQATAAIRGLEGSRSQVPILGFTANALREDLDACLTAGMNDFVSKPVEKQHLLDTIAHWILHKKSEAPSAPPLSSQEPDLVPLLDGAALQYLTAQTDEQTMHDTVDIFFADTAQRLEKLQQAVGAKNFQRVGFEAHSIKSAALTIGALRLAKNCKNLETSCNHGNIESALQIAQGIDKLFQETRAAFRAIHNHTTKAD
jgi:CheY-like chemotaxis protein